MVWGNTEAEVIKNAPHCFEGPLSATRPKSLTFIPGDIYGNQALLKTDPGYLANLMAQSEEEKSRLLLGNWKIRTDNLSLMNFGRIGDIFSNYPANTTTKCITCDASRFGRDFTVIMVWNGWQVVSIKVFYQTEAKDIVEAIEKSRADHGIGKSMVLIDQDGVGDGAVKLGGYQGFHGGTAALPEPGSKVKENYANLKAQCWYRFGKHVNDGEVHVIISNENIEVQGTRST